MTVETFRNVLKDRTRRGFDGARGDLLGDIRAIAQTHSRTGEGAASYRFGQTSVDGARIHARVGSPLVQARAVEQGANVGPRKGPHMTGLFILREAVTRNFAARMRDRLR